MKILLVLPAAEHLRVTRERPSVSKREMQRFSVLSLTTVAALTPARHEVTLCDENVSALDFDQDVDVVGVSFMTALAPRAYEIAAQFRGRGRVTVAGGYHPTLRPEEAARHFDAVVAGEAEGSWQRVLADIEAGRPLGVYRRDQPCDGAEIPAPRRDLTNATERHYVTTHAVQTGRGCSHACRYCSIAAFFRGSQRNRPLARVMEEVRSAPRDFMFVDDNIIADREYARELFRALKPLGKRWVSQCSIEIADDADLLRLAREAGCRGLFVGVETLSAENLAEMEKGFNDSRGYRRKIAAIRRSGIGVVAGVIVGLDHDDAAVFERTLAFLNKTGIDAAQVNILTPLPGTPLYDDFERQGRIVDRDWSHYDFRHCVIRPARMSGQELQDGADWLYARFYRLDRILIRFVKAVFTTGWTPAVVALKLSLTYRYDNLREGIVGRNPARAARAAAWRRWFAAVWPRAGAEAAAGP